MQNTSALYDQIISNPNHWFEPSVVIGEPGILISDQGEDLVFGSGDGATRILVDTGGPESGFRKD